MAATNHFRGPLFQHSCATPGPNVGASIGECDGACSWLSQLPKARSGAILMVALQEESCCVRWANATLKFLVTRFVRIPARLDLHGVGRRQYGFFGGSRIGYAPCDWVDCAPTCCPAFNKATGQQVLWCHRSCGHARHGPVRRRDSLMRPGTRPASHVAHLVIAGLMASVSSGMLSPQSTHRP